MSDEEKKAKEEQEQKEQKEALALAEAKKAENEQHMIPKSRLDEEIAKRKDLEGRMSAFEKAQKEAEEERLQANEEFKTLAEKRQAEIAELQPKAAVAEEQGAALQGLLDAQIAELPEDMQSLVPTGMSVIKQFEWLTKNKAKIMKPAGPDIYAGERGGTRDKTVADLTPEEKQVAAKMRLTEEEYANGKK